MAKDVPLRQIHVTCAIIEHDGKVLAAQRSVTMSMPGKWEFPGGKIEPNEAPEDCLTRELFEELGSTISVEKPLPLSSHQYPAFTVILHPFICSLASNAIVMHEHAAIVWLPPEKLYSLDWAEADIAVIAAYFAERGITTP